MTSKEFVLTVSHGHHILVFVACGLYVSFGFSAVFDTFYVCLGVDGCDTSMTYCSKQNLCSYFFSLLEYLKDPKIEII